MVLSVIRTHAITSDIASDKTLLDELPMIYGSCVYLYTLRCYCKPKNTYNSWNAFIACLYSLTATFVYVILKSPLLFQSLYGWLVCYMVYETILLCKKEPQLKKLGFSSLLFYFIGFVLWNIDNNFCATLRSIRFANMKHDIVDGLLQLHAWWHIFAGYGTFLQLLFTIHARHLFLKKPCFVKNITIWPYLDVQKVD